MTTDTQIKERPILFSEPMVCAILAGHKTQTRRVIKPQPPRVIYRVNDLNTYVTTSRHSPDEPDWSFSVRCPYGGPGDRLWVKETFAYVPSSAYRGSEGVKQTISPSDPDEAAIYRAGWTLSKPAVRWRSGRFMPRWASRITLEITEVRVQRLADISGEDALREGVTLPEMKNRFHVADPTVEFMDLWDSINGKTYPWALSPWVWAISFVVVPQ